MHTHTHTHTHKRTQNYFICDRSLAQVLPIVRLLRLVGQVLRLVRVLNVNGRTKEIVLTIIGVIPSAMRLIMIIWAVLYFYAVIGMEAWNGCLTNATAVAGSSYAAQQMEPLNFDSFPAALLTTFTMMGKRKMPVLLEGTVACSQNYLGPFVYFFSFFILVCAFLLNVFVAFILNIFVVVKTFDKSIKPSLPEPPAASMGIAGGGQERGNEDAENLSPSMVAPIREALPQATHRRSSGGLPGSRKVKSAGSAEQMQVQPRDLTGTTLQERVGQLLRQQVKTAHLMGQGAKDHSARTEAADHFRSLSVPPFSVANVSDVEEKAMYMRSVRPKAREVERWIGGSHHGFALSIVQKISKLEPELRASAEKNLERLCLTLGIDKSAVSVQMSGGGHVSTKSGPL